MARLRFIDGRIDADAGAVVTVLRVLSGMFGGAVVGVDDVAAGAAAAAIVTGLVVGSGKAEQRVKQAGLLQAEKDRVGTQLGAEAAIAELEIGVAGKLFGTGNARLRLLLTAALKNAEDIAGLRDLPALERVEIGQNAFGAGFFGGWRRKGAKTLGRAVRSVRLAEVRVLERKCAVVVKRRAP